MFNKLFNKLKVFFWAQIYTRGSRHDKNYLQLNKYTWHNNGCRTKSSLNLLEQDRILPDLAI